MVIFLSCVKSKNNRPCMAKDMYISELFKKSLMYAQSLQPRKIYILSAKYGVLELNDTIRPYELTLNKKSEQEKKRWAYTVIQQLKGKGQDFDEKAVFLCGENYRKYVMQKFANATAPLKGVSFGNQLKFYKENVRKPQ